MVLKLTFNKPKKGEQSSAQPQQASATPQPAQTPAPAPSSTNKPSQAPGQTSHGPKLKLKLGHSSPPPANEPPALKSKGAGGAGSQPTKAKPPTLKAPSLKIKKPKPAPTPTPKADEPKPQGKKRPRTELKLSGPKGPTASAAKPPVQPIKRIRFNAKPPPAIRLKSKGEPPRRPKGVGYDSEASDTEIDPALEEEFVLRMQPGEDCDYLRQAIEEKRFGPPSRGGADVSFKSLTRDGRRAVVTIRGHVYAATLVDLPCVLEAMKSWDKRGWYKSADVCQMLLVLGRVNNEEEAKTYPLPKDVDGTSFQFAHGLTPPLRWARKRRFRKRISNRTIEAVELEVARLLKEDNEAVEPPEFEVLDYAQLMREEEEAAAAAAGYGGEYDDTMDAEGEVDYMDYQDANANINVGEGGDDLFEDAFAAEMEAALAAHAEEAGEPGESVTGPSTGAAGPSLAGPNRFPADPLTSDQPAESVASTPRIKQEEEGGSEMEPQENEEESSEEDNNDNEEDDMDDEELEKQRQMKEAQEEIAELENMIASETSRWEKLTNPILRGKLGRTIQTLKHELELKRVALGQGGE